MNLRTKKYLMRVEKITKEYNTCTFQLEGQKGENELIKKVNSPLNFDYLYFQS